MRMQKPRIRKADGDGVGRFSWRFLPLLSPFTPHILSYAPIALLMVEHIRMRPNRYTSTGAPHRGYPHKGTKLVVVGDGVHARIQPGEHVQRRLGLDAGDARYGGDELPGQIALGPRAVRQ